jgi:DNA-binding MarR family transcriptional regulator
VGSLLARSRRLVFQKARRRLEDLGESIFVWRLLAYLADEGPASQTELADAVAQHPASISRLLDDVERDGLVHRSRDDADRRRVVVELTPKGKQKYLDLYEEAMSVVEEALQPLDAHEQEQLAGLLEKMIATKSPA